MKRSEKRGIIISIIVIVMGLIGIIYTTIVKESVEESGYMYSLGFSYFTMGIVLMCHFFKLSKNKKESDKQNNIYTDERINSNKNKAFAITFKIIIWTSVVVDFIVTFFARQFQNISDYLNVFIGCSIFIYLIVYYFISKKN